LGNLTKLEIQIQFKVDKEVTFNSVSKLKSSKPILDNANNKSVLKE